MKSTRTFWNPLAKDNTGDWEIIDSSKGYLSQLTIAEHPDTGDYKRLTMFKDGYSTDAFGPKSHDYPDEIFVVSGYLYDKTFGMTGLCNGLNKRCTNYDIK